MNHFGEVIPPILNGTEWGENRQDMPTQSEATRRLAELNLTVIRKAAPTERMRRARMRAYLEGDRQLGA
jgi:hypothetical protein